MSKIVNHLIRLDFVRRTPDPLDQMQINASDRERLFACIAVIVDVIEKTRRADT
jgi:hypothetical protein